MWLRMGKRTIEQVIRAKEIFVDASHSRHLIGAGVIKSRVGMIPVSVQINAVPRMPGSSGNGSRHIIGRDTQSVHQQRIRQAIALADRLVRQENTQCRERSVCQIREIFVAFSIYDLLAKFLIQGIGNLRLAHPIVQQGIETFHTFFQTRINVGQGGRQNSILRQKSRQVFGMFQIHPVTDIPTDFQVKQQGMTAQERIVHTVCLGSGDMEFLDSDFFLTPQNTISQRTKYTSLFPRFIHSSLQFIGVVFFFLRFFIRFFLLVCIIDRFYRGFFRRCLQFFLPATEKEQATHHPQPQGHGK